MFGINREDEPDFPNDPLVPEMKNQLFEFIDQGGLTLPEIMEVMRDYERFYYGDIDRPNYVDEEKMDWAREQIDDE